MKIKGENEERTRKLDMASFDFHVKAIEDLAFKK